MTPAVINGLLDHLGYLIALVIFQLWNMYQHKQNVTRIETNRDLVDSGYAALHKDFLETKAAVATANEAIARMASVFDRRAPGPGRGAAQRTTITPEEASIAQANGFGERWTDPRTPRPEGA